MAAAAAQPAEARHLVVHSLREQIREHILEGIVSGRWQPGERIVERRIAVELQVSQTPVREALRELEALRLIESAPNKGVRVRGLTAAHLKESYPVRAGLEQVAAELAAERLAQDPSALEHEVGKLLSRACVHAPMLRLHHLPRPTCDDQPATGTNRSD